MKTDITFYGQLTDVTGTDTISLEDVRDTDELLVLLKERYPELGSKKFILAAGTKIVANNTSLKECPRISLLPPFSGG